MKRRVIVVAAGLVVVLVWLVTGPGRGPAPAQVSAFPSWPGTPSPSWTAEDPEQELAEASAEFVRVWLGASTDPAWRAKLERWCTPALAAELAGVDPQQVPAGEVLEGRPVRVDGDAFAAVAVVETSVGRMRLDWLWSGTRWEVTGYAPPRS